MLGYMNIIYRLQTEKIISASLSEILVHKQTWQNILGEFSYESQLAKDTTTIDR